MITGYKLFLAGIAVFIVIMFSIAYQVNDECDKKGGVRLRGAVSKYHCYEASSLKVIEDTK